ncbi:unnamed protein product [Closterium sp. NIES-54]
MALSTCAPCTTTDSYKVYSCPPLPSLFFPLCTCASFPPPISYTHASNGFAAILTAAQVQRMRRRRCSFLKRPHFRAAPFTLVAAAAAAAPAAATPATAAATPAAATPAAATPAGAPSDGDGTVIGIVDSGVWPEHPSFDDTVRWEPSIAESLHWASGAAIAAAAVAAATAAAATPAPAPAPF